MTKYTNEQIALQEAIKLSISGTRYSVDTVEHYANKFFEWLERKERLRTTGTDANLSPKL